MAGGQALGYEQAGIQHVCLIDNDKNACATLRKNRPQWNVIQADLNEFDASPYKGVDIVSGACHAPRFPLPGSSLAKKMNATCSRLLYEL